MRRGRHQVVDVRGMWEGRLDSPPGGVDEAVIVHWKLW